MKTLLSIAFVAVAAAAFFATEAQADNTNGVCNAIIATDLGAAQVCENAGCMPGDAACMDVTNAFIEFVTTPGCLEAFADGELEGLVGSASAQPGGPNAGGVKHIQEVICGAIEDCGLCPSALMIGACPEICTD